MDVGKERVALAIFDGYRGQTTDSVEVLKEGNGPAGCTNQLQPLGSTVNRVTKAFCMQGSGNGMLNKHPISSTDDDSDTDFHPGPIIDLPKNLDEERWSEVDNRGTVYKYFCDNPIHAVNGLITSSVV